MDDYNHHHTTKEPSVIVDYERRWRLCMDHFETEAADRMFREILDFRYLSNANRSTLLLKAWEFASAINYEHGNIPSRIYLNHPLRVASILTTKIPNISDETLVIALLHNVLEVSKTTSREIQDLFGEPVTVSIKALAIDRSRKDKNYLMEYYSHIEAISTGSAMVKVADKLDNIYMICFNPSLDIRTSYLDEIDEWVIPLAARTVPQLVHRLQEASIVMRELGFLNRNEELEIARKDVLL